MTIRRDSHHPPRSPFPPGEPDPSRPAVPGVPGPPQPPGVPPSVPGPEAAPARAWAEPGDWPGWLYERLLGQRIVMAHGYLGEEAATRLCAQVLTLDAEGAGPIRLEMQNLGASLPAALTVMGVLDTVRAPVTAQAAGRTAGPGLGVLAAARHRLAYASAVFELSEPRVGFEGTAQAVASHEKQVQVMLGELYRRLAAVTGRGEEEIRADARRERTFTAGEAIGYGLVEGLASAGRA